MNVPASAIFSADEPAGQYDDASVRRDCMRKAYYRRRNHQSTPNSPSSLPNLVYRSTILNFFLFDLRFEHTLSAFFRIQCQYLAINTTFISIMKI